MQIWTTGRRMGTTYNAVEAAICLLDYIRHTLHLVQFYINYNWRDGTGDVSSNHWLDSLHFTSRNILEKWIILTILALVKDQTEIVRQLVEKFWVETG